MNYLRNVILGIVAGLVIIFIFVIYAKHQNAKTFPQNTDQTINYNSSTEVDSFTEAKKSLPENFPFPTDVVSVNSVTTSPNSIAFSYQTSTDTQSLIMLYKGYFQSLPNWEVDNSTEAGTTSISAIGENTSPLTLSINSKDSVQYVRVSYIKR